MDTKKKTVSIGTQNITRKKDQYVNKRDLPIYLRKRPAVSGPEDDTRKRDSYERKRDVYERKRDLYERKRDLYERTRDV